MMEFSGNCGSSFLLGKCIRQGEWLRFVICGSSVERILLSRQVCMCVECADQIESSLCVGCSCVLLPDDLCVNCYVIATAKTAIIPEACYIQMSTKNTN